MKYIKLKMSFDKIVSRTVVVPADWSLAFLHDVIQETFGWLDYHQYEFAKSKKIDATKWTTDSEEFSDLGEYLESSQTSISALLNKKGAKLHYIYDLGDYNEVEIVSLGNVSKPAIEDFETVGPDVVEDSTGIGGIEGILKIVEEGKGKQYKMLKDWLSGAFGKTPEQVLAFPSVTDIYSRVFKLVKTASLANPKALSDCWDDYRV